MSSGANTATIGTESSVTCPGNFRKHANDDYETCSYCGSVKFEDMLAAVENGHSIIPTDKRYKLYVMMPNKEPLEEVVVGWCNGNEAPGPEWEKDGEGRWTLTRPKGTSTQMKFYMDHMPEEKFELFLDLYKGGVMNVAAPGYFYAWGF